MKKEKGAKCPNAQCDKRFLWDNSSVVYMTTEREWCKEKVILNEQTEEKDGIIVTMYQCPKCGVILGFMCNDPLYGGPVFNHPEWEDVSESDWMDKYHV